MEHRALLHSIRLTLIDPTGPNTTLPTDPAAHLGRWLAGPRQHGSGALVSFVTRTVTSTPVVPRRYSAHAYNRHLDAKSGGKPLRLLQY